jgi:ABC-type sugar transport system permease subunit
MIVIIWETVGGFQMLFFLAGLRQIPQQMYDMATLDGLNIWQRIRSVYWPWLKNLALFNLCLGLLGAMQGGFEIAYIMTGGGPLRSTTTLSFFLFENSFQWQRVGYAAAVGVVMFILVLPLLLFAGGLSGRERKG